MPDTRAGRRLDFSRECQPHGRRPSAQGRRLHGVDDRPGADDNCGAWAILNGNDPREAVNSMDREIEQYRKVVRDEWTNGDTVAAWARWHPKITEQQVNMREALIEHARLEPGMRVLDLACGTGDPAIEIARRVGPNGHVTASDLSPRMLEECRKNAAAAGITNMDFVAADAEKFTVRSGEL